MAIFAGYLGKYLYIKENELEAGKNVDLIYVKNKR